MRKFASSAGALALLAAMQAHAIPFQGTGAGSAVDTADRTATFDDLNAGDSLNPYTEDGLVLQVDDTAYINFDPDAGANQFAGGFYYANGGVNSPYVLTTSLTELMFGVEFALGSGYFADYQGDLNSDVFWRTFREGSLTGSGSGNFALGSIIGIGDDEGFDELHLSNGETNALAIDNLRVDLGGPVSVPEPGSLALFGLGLAGLGLIRRRRSV